MKVCDGQKSPGKEKKERPAPVKRYGGDGIF